MKDFQNLIITFLFFAFAFPSQGISQTSFEETAPTEMSYEIERVYVPLSISRDQLEGATSMLDLNEYFKSSWVKEYVSVEIIATNDGSLKTAATTNDTLSHEQIDILRLSDEGTDISVKVNYLPANNLVQNDVKEESFSFVVYPDNAAAYVGGYAKLKQYLKEHAVEKIQAGVITGYAMAAVKFAIDTEGHVTNAHIFESSKDEETDALLLDVICNMPSWNPAEYQSGLKVDQELMFSVGSSESCVVNLLGVRRER